MIDGAALVTEAADLAGSDDWGDRRFVATLDLLVESCRSSAELSPLGWKVLRQVVLRHLRNRLYIQRHLAAHPEVRGDPIRAAVVITGLPRTGTTLLHSLLALDPDNRVLRVWEALHPVPATPGTATADDRLIDKAETWLAGLYSLVPEFRSIHPQTAEGPQECDVLLQNSFASQHFDDMFDAREYSSWLNSADLAAEYSEYGVQLRVLASGDQQQRPWVLKSPSHLGHLPELMNVLPDALVVHCHRHPYEAVPSYASLVRAVRSPYSEVSPAVVGEQCLQRCRLAMDRALQARDAQDTEGGFIDVAYAALIRRPTRVVGEIYERLERPLTAAFEAAMVSWLADNSQHKHGVHHYGLEDFGLTPDAVEQAFAPYLDHFALAITGEGHEDQTASKLGGTAPSASGAQPSSRDPRPRRR